MSDQNGSRRPIPKHPKSYHNVIDALEQRIRESECDMETARASNLLADYLADNAAAYRESVATWGEYRP